MSIRNLFDLRGERVFLTGAGGAIGGATARVCAALGAELYVADLKAPDELAKEIGAKAAFALDNTKRDDVNAVVKEIGGTLDALVDTSGYYVKGDWLEGGDEWESPARPHHGHQRQGAGEPDPRRAARHDGPQEDRIVLTSSIGARNAGSTLAVEPAPSKSVGRAPSLHRRVPPLPPARCWT
jgi:NAD(P)-dependent dehydrogenase (short-subunit alcohol dehydrogenase family)